METVLNWLDLESNTWIVHVFAVVFVTVVINAILRLIISRLLKRADKSRLVWDDSLLLALKRPLLLFVWVMGISLAAEIIEPVTDSELFSYTGVIRRIAIVGLLMMFLTGFIRNVENSILRKNETSEIQADKITVRVIARLLRLSVIITGALVILQEMGVSISGVLAFGGIGGIAVGFAAKDLLANFFGGMMIYLDRPFSVGDWVRSPDREIEGVVEDIGWRLTRIRTFDKRPLYIPNAAFTTISVVNPSRMLNRRIFETFGLRYSDSARIRGIVSDVKKMLEQHEDIDQDQIVIVNFDKLSASSLDFFIYAFTKTTVWAEYHEIKQDVLLKVIDIIHEHGADVAFPTRTLDGLDALRFDKDANPR